MIGRRIEDGELLRFNGEGHLLTLAPTRSGKGVSAVIPNLLDYPGSVLVIDVKPENAPVTARRRRELGQKVRILDPFDVAGGGDGFNPLDLIDVSSPDAIDDARMIADMMVAVDEGAENVHWNETARAFLAGLTLFVKVHAAPEDRHLLHIRKLATLRRGTPKSPGAFEELLNHMLDSNAVDGLVARSAAVLLQKPFKERGSVISALHRPTEFLDSPHLRRRSATRPSIWLISSDAARACSWACPPTASLNTTDGCDSWSAARCACSCGRAAGRRIACS